MQSCRLSSAIFGLIFIVPNTGHLRLVSVAPAGGTTVQLSFADGAEYQLELGPDLRGLSGPLVEPLQ